MNQVEQNCWERWGMLKSRIELIRLKKGAGMDTQADKAYAAQLLGELRLYHAADLIPDEMKEEWAGKMGQRLEKLIQ